jgi:hypothetical protein
MILGSIITALSILMTFCYIMVRKAETRKQVRQIIDEKLTLTNFLLFWILPGLGVVTFGVVPLALLLYTYYKKEKDLPAEKAIEEESEEDKEDPAE